MLRKERGSLTIEASLAMTVFMFFLLTFIAIGRYSTTQNRVNHSLDQTAVTMSAKNNQLTQLNEWSKSLTGADGTTLASFIGMFNVEAASFVADIVPYTSDVSSLMGDKSKIWTNSKLKLEVARYFAYYYLDCEWAEVKNLEYDAITTKLSENGIKNIDFVGVGTDGKFIEDNKLKAQITYTVDTPFSFHSFFGITDEPTLSYTVTMRLDSSE